MRGASAIIACILLAGCSLAPPYKPPETPCSSGWKEADPYCCQTMVDTERWWQLFDDPCLDALEAIALQQNPSLESAYERVIAAEAVASQMQSPFFPRITVNPFGVNLMSRYDPAQFGLPQISPFRAHLQEYAVPVMASYELDLFGKIRNGYFAACNDAQARAFAFEGVKLTLTTDIALTYFRIRSLDGQNMILRETVDSRKSELALLQSRYDAGLINASDVARARSQLASEEAELAQRLLERAKDEHLLATLLGCVASDYTLDVCPLSGTPPCVAPCLPSELLCRRPDVHEAERRMAAENARIGVARSLYFPSLQLTGALGYASPTIGDLFDWQARLWMWAVNAAQTLYDAGHTTAAVDLAKARYLENVAEYTKTTLNAFREVESALAEEQSSRARFASYGVAVEASAEVVLISNERYLKGLVAYLEVEDANRTLLRNRLQREQSRYEGYEAAIALVKALGGGFAAPSCQLTFLFP